MAKAFRVVSWNVEHFKGDPARSERVVDLLQSQDPDIFALYEVEGSKVFSDLTAKMPDFTFHITEGPQVQEILVGVRQGLTSFFTQKLQFKSAQPTLRPGALLTVTVDGANYTLLFLHAKSGDDPRGFGLRDDMLYRAAKFQNTLDSIVDGDARANYIFMGDLNTMGMTYPYVRVEDVRVTHEWLRLDRHAGRRGMRRLVKDEKATFWGGPGSTLPPSDLDHVVASKHLAFEQFNGSDVTVLGWPKAQGDQARGDWINRFSDHALLMFEVRKAV